MLFTRSRVIHAEFDMWGRLANISVTGETSTRGMSRIKKPSNGLYAHLKENKGHKINWEGFVYLDSERNWKRRKIKEALYINAVNPAEAMGSNKILNLEKGYDLDPVWSGFNEEYRNIIAKKIGVTKK